MDYVQLLKDEIASGFSKSDLEFLIGLPKNSLSGVINQGRPLSKKSKAKIEAFLQSDKPDPTTFKRIKEVVKENNKPEVTNQVIDSLLETGMAITETTEEGVRAIHPFSDEGWKVQEQAKIQKRISQIDEMLKMPPKYLPKEKRTKLQTELAELKSQLLKLS
jgi:hypothetical protein